MTRRTCPLKATEALNDGFLENRARLLEVAAFLDRIDRCAHSEQAEADFRYQALRKALEILATATADRAKALLLAWSDPTAQPLESAAGLKGAYGAWPGETP